MEYHVPVLLNETIQQLNVRAGHKYIDCTLGDGGHTLELLKLGALVMGMDYNADSLSRSTERITAMGLSQNFTPVLGNFAHIEKLSSENGYNLVDGILYDLGYSTSQMDSDTGLSFLTDQPLDMRLDESLGVTAADLVNSLNEKQLADMFFEYSDERQARKFAKTIVNARNLKRLTTTKELADLIKSVAAPGYEHGRIHPATRVFQALRIAVNLEIDNLEISLPQAAQILLPGGRMCVITFHSTEDRVVKEFGRTARLGENTRLVEVVKKPIVPTEQEVGANFRSRSAKLRVFEKTA